MRITFAREMDKRQAEEALLEAEKKAEEKAKKEKEMREKAEARIAELRARWQAT